MQLRLLGGAERVADCVAGLAALLLLGQRLVAARVERAVERVT